MMSSQKMKSQIQMAKLKKRQILDLNHQNCSLSTRYRILGHYGFLSQTKWTEIKNGKIVNALLLLSTRWKIFGPCITISSSHQNSMQGVIIVLFKEGVKPMW